MLRTVFFPQQLHRYVFTLQFMMNFNSVWKRQLTPYTNARPRVQKVAQRRIAHLLRRWPTQLRLCGFLQQFLNRTYANLGAAAGLSD